MIGSDRMVSWWQGGRRISLTHINVQQQKNKKKKKKKEISPTPLLSLGKFYNRLLIEMEIIIIICV